MLYKEKQEKRQDERIKVKQMELRRCHKSARGTKVSFRHGVNVRMHPNDEQRVEISSMG